MFNLFFLSFRVSPSSFVLTKGDRSKRQLSFLLSTFRYLSRIRISAVSFVPSPLRAPRTTPVLPDTFFPVTSDPLTPSTHHTPRPLPNVDLPGFGGWVFCCIAVTAGKETTRNRLNESPSRCIGSLCANLPSWGPCGGGPCGRGPCKGAPCCGTAAGPAGVSGEDR